MIHENAVAQAIAAQGKKLFFYTHYSEEKHRNDIEVDFLLSSGEGARYKVRPIEVKSAKNYTNVSYNRFREKFGKKVGGGLVVHPKQLACDASGCRIPSYMLFCAIEYMQKEPQR